MSKRNIILFVVLALLVGGFMLKGYLDDQTVKKNIELENKSLLPGLTKDQIMELKIADTEKNTTVTLAKMGDQWVVKDKDNFPADKTLVDKAVEALPKLRFGHKVGEFTEESKQKYGFDKAVEVTVQGKTIVMGQPAGARLPIKFENAIYLSPTNDRAIFARYDGEWRERKLFPGQEPADVIAVKLAVAGQPEITVTLDDKGEATVAGITGADAQKAKSLLTAIGGLRVSSFIDTPPVTVGEVEKDKKMEPLAKGIVTVSFKNGATATLELAGLKLKDKPDYLISKGGRVFGLSEYYYNKLAKPDLMPGSPTAPKAAVGKPVKK
ncbi:MAG TPA: DUF4340 domain-containing protein [bacterium]|nr:DUF4340 domain-containing protein [bacterium]